MKQSYLFLLLVGIMPILGCRTTSMVSTNPEFIKLAPKTETLKFTTLGSAPNGKIPEFLLLDSALVLHVYHGEQVNNLYKFSLRTNTFSQGFLPIGRGPNEGVGISGIGSFGNTLWAFDRVGAKIMTGNLDSIQKFGHAVFHTLSLKTQFSEIDFVDSHTIICSATEPSTKKYRMFDIKDPGNYVDFGEYGSDLIQNELAFAFRGGLDGELFVHKNKAVYFYYFADAFDIIDTKKKYVKTFVNDIAIEPEIIRTQIDKKYEFLVQDETVFTYRSCYATDKYIYLPYSGSDSRTLGADVIYANQIMVFDWEGNHIKDFLVKDVKMYTIAVSEDDKTIYSFDYDSGNIVKAEINLK